MYMKKKTIVKKAKHNGDLHKRDLKNLNKLKKVQQYLMMVLQNIQIHKTFKSNTKNAKIMLYYILVLKNINIK